MINKIVGESMSRIRKQNQVLMKDLANAINISQPRLSRIENGEQDIPISLINDFCRYFGISLSSFIKLLESDDTKNMTVEDKMIKIIYSMSDEQKKALFTILSSLESKS